MDYNLKMKYNNTSTRITRIKRILRIQSHDMVENGVHLYKLVDSIDIIDFNFFII